MMANTYTQLYIHIVFAVRGRENLIMPEQRVLIQRYMTGIVQQRGHKMLAIFCMPDHVHLLVGLNPTMPISDLVRDIKSISSKWINESKLMRQKFRWQEGFGAFSYSRSHLHNVIRYINNQEEHHRKQKFREEYQEILKNFDVEFDPKYLFKWIE